MLYKEKMFIEFTVLGAESPNSMALVAMRAPWLRHSVVDGMVMGASMKGRSHMARQRERGNI